MTALIPVFGFSFLGLGAWASLGARSFATTVADFGAYNPHLIHDVGITYLAFGTALLIAWRNPAWRVPVLGVTALWNGLHAVTHFTDLGHAHSFVVGIVEAAALVATTAVLVWLAVREAR